MTALRVSLVDPSAFTPPYDRSLAEALARAGADVELLTSEFLYGPVPAPVDYRVTKCFYRHSTKAGVDHRGRLPVKALEHIPDMLAVHERRAAASPPPTSSTGSGRRCRGSIAGCSASAIPPARGC